MYWEIANDDKLLHHQMFESLPQETMMCGIKSGLMYNHSWLDSPDADVGTIFTYNKD